MRLKVRPEESTEFPPREHNDVTPGYLPSTVACCRWFWETFQPEPGRSRPLFHTA